MGTRIGFSFQKRPDKCVEFIGKSEMKVVSPFWHDMKLSSPDVSM